MTEYGTFRRSLSLPQVEEITIRTNSSPAKEDQGWRVKQRRQQCALCGVILPLATFACIAIGGKSKAAMTLFKVTSAASTGPKQTQAGDP